LNENDRRPRQALQAAGVRPGAKTTILAHSAIF
jgi:hypothetical protein